MSRVQLLVRIRTFPYSQTEDVPYLQVGKPLLDPNFTTGRFARSFLGQLYPDGLLDGRELGVLVGVLVRLTKPWEGPCRFSAGQGLGPELRAFKAPLSPALRTTACLKNRRV